MTHAATLRRPQRLVLGDVLAGSRTRDALLVAGGAGLTVLGAQISILTPVSPVPITGQTLAVVIAGAALGARRGAASQLLYLLLGLALPVYAEGGQGFDVIWGASGGYIVGFIFAAAAVGWLAEHGADRVPSRAILTFIAGQLIVFGIGVPWLKVAVDLDWSTAIHEGFTIFIFGGLVKAVIAGFATPAAWRLVRRIDRSAR
jgi:biotin transport system substrate-specific component